jgi:hypothetical protein
MHHNIHDSSLETNFYSLQFSTVLRRTYIIYVVSFCLGIKFRCYFHTFALQLSTIVFTLPQFFVTSFHTFASHIQHLCCTFLSWHKCSSLLPHFCVATFHKCLTLPWFFVAICHDFVSHIQHMHHKFLYWHKCSSLFSCFCVTTFHNFFYIATVFHRNCDEVLN